MFSNKDAEKDQESVESQAENVKSLKNQEQSRKNHQGSKKKEAFLKFTWTRNHASKDSLKAEKTIQNLSVTDQFGVPAAGLQVITRRSNRDMWINNKENVDEKTDNKLIELTRDISKRLKAEVFIEEGEEIIGYTKTLLDLPSLALKMKKEQSSLKVAFNGFPE